MVMCLSVWSDKFLDRVTRKFLSNKCDDSISNMLLSSGSWARLGDVDVECFTDPFDFFVGLTELNIVHFLVSIVETVWAESRKALWCRV